MKRRIFAILAFLLCVTSVHAAVGQAVIDGMNYVLSTDGEVRTATLVAGDKKYAGRVVIPKNVNLIKNYAFADCIKLASVTILSDAISITGANVFQNCSALDSLVFGESVNTIRSSSFNLGNRTNVISLAKYPPVCEGDTSPFAGVSPYCVLYVPKGRAADYRMAKGWAGQFRAVDDMNDSSHSANCDVNGDGVVDIADATALIECILAK